MAIAGKVAITLSTENNGAWSANVTYDRLVAVKHNNNLYISRKTVANVEPPNNEFWFLALEGFSGDDIEDIINGTTQVGNAKTLDGHGAEYFAKGTDLAKYLPLTGGRINSTGQCPLSINSTKSDGIGTLLEMFLRGTYIGSFGIVNGEHVVYDAGANRKTLLHTGNKPSGSYTGNGDATQRTINIGGTGSFLLICESQNLTFVSNFGSVAFHVNGQQTKYFTSNELRFADGILYMATADGSVNYNGANYVYLVP